jgi:N-acetylneuraminic acid mutarotase
MKNFIVLLATFFLLNFANAQWVEKASMYNYGRVSAVGCSLNDKGYVGLGQIYKSLYIDDFWEYNPVSDLWSRKADYPGGGRNGATAYAANGKIYVFFGIDNQLVCHNDVWEYNPATDKWLQKADFPGQGRLNARGFVFGDSTIFIGTGSYQSTYNYLFAHP